MNKREDQAAMKISVNISVEMDGDAKGYGHIHTTGCRDLKDDFPVGQAIDKAEAEYWVEAETGWEPPFHFAPCTKALKKGK